MSGAFARSQGPAPASEQLDHGEQAACGAGDVMERFLSSAVNRIDAKGRVPRCPRIFAPCSRRGVFSELYALRCLDQPALDVGGMDLLERYEERIAMEDPFSAGHRRHVLFHSRGRGPF